MLMGLALGRGDTLVFGLVLRKPSGAWPAPLEVGRFGFLLSYAVLFPDFFVYGAVPGPSGMGPPQLLQFGDSWHPWVGRFPPHCRSDCGEAASGSVSPLDPTVFGLRATQGSLGPQASHIGLPVTVRCP